MRNNKTIDISGDSNKEFKFTFIVITHDQRIAQQAERILEIKDGRINMDILTSNPQETKKAWSNLATL